MLYTHLEYYREAEWGGDYSYPRSPANQWRASGGIHDGMLLTFLARPRCHHDARFTVDAHRLCDQREYVAPAAGVLTLGGGGEWGDGGGCLAAAELRAGTIMSPQISLHRRAGTRAASKVH